MDRGAPQDEMIVPCIRIAPQVDRAR
jgi:hypothetical protein